MFPCQFSFFFLFFENFNTSWLLAQGSPLDMTMKTRHIYSSRVVRKIQEFLTFTVLHQPDLFRSSFVHISLILSVRIICAAAAMPVLFQSRVKGITVPWCKRGTKNCPQSPPVQSPFPLTNPSSSSTLFLLLSAKPVWPLRPPGQLVWHRLPSPSLLPLPRLSWGLSVFFNVGYCSFVFSLFFQGFFASPKHSIKFDQFLPFVVGIWNVQAGQELWIDAKVLLDKSSLAQTVSSKPHCNF